MRRIIGSNVTTILVTAFVLGLMLFAASPSANAQFLGQAGWDRKTTITINKTWEVPGATLPAGTYVLRLLNLGQGGGATRTVVVIFNKDETEVLATVLGLTAYRVTDTEGVALHFYEASGSDPKPLHTWFYPGGNGIEFVYARNR